MKIKLSEKDKDITLVTPNGTEIMLQWRVEGEGSLDICIDGEEKYLSYNWIGNDLTPAPINKEKNVHEINQVTIIGHFIDE